MNAGIEPGNCRAWSFGTGFRVGTNVSVVSVAPSVRSVFRPAESGAALVTDATSEAPAEIEIDTRDQNRSNLASA